MTAEIAAIIPTQVNDHVGKMGCGRDHVR